MSLLSLWVFSIILTLCLGAAVDSSFFIDPPFTDVLTSSSALSLQYTTIPLFVYYDAESKRKEIIKDNSKKSGVYR
jgi:hypothetical protein